MAAPHFAVVLMWVALLAALWRAGAPVASSDAPDVKRLWRIGGTLAACAGLIVLWMAIQIGPVDEDDWYFFVIGRWFSQHFFSSDAWAHLLFEYGNPREPIFRPLSKLWLAVCYSLFGNYWPAWHVATIALQLGVVVLVYRLALTLAADRWVAFAAAALYGLHPSHAEVVGWICQHETLLMTGAVVFAVLLHVQDKPRTAALVALGAMLCKEQAFATVGAIVLVDLYASKIDWRRWVPSLVALAAIFAWRGLVLAEPNNPAHAGFLTHYLSIGVGDLMTGLLLSAPAVITVPVVDGLWPLATVVSAVAAVAGSLVIVFAARSAGRVATLKWTALAGLWAFGMMVPGLTELELPSMPHDALLAPNWHLRHTHVALVLPCIAFAWALRQLPGTVRAASAVAAIAVFGAGLILNLSPFVDASARVGLAAQALDSRDWPENAGVRLVEPLDPVAPLLVFRKVIDPGSTSLPLLIGEPRCGCAALSATFDTAQLRSLREVTKRYQEQRLEADEVTDPGLVCECPKWREDAVWYRLVDGVLVAH